MKKIILILAITVIPVLIYAEEKVYEAETITHFEQASSAAEGLYYDNASSHEGSYFICCFYGEDNILILDTNNKYFYEFDLFEGITEIRKIEETSSIDAHRMDVTENGIELFNNFKPDYFQFDLDFSLKVCCELTYLNGNFGVNYDTQSRAIYFENNTAFFWLENGAFLSIKNPGTDIRENNRNILGTDDTKALFSPETDFTLDGLSIVGNGNYMLRDNRLLTNSYYQYIKYQEFLDPSYAYLSGHEYRIFSETSPFHYIGTDIEGNRYYTDLTNYLIFDIDGYCFERFEMNREGGMSVPFIDETGNIYYLELLHQFDIKSGPEGPYSELVGVDYYIKKIPRTWGLPEQAQIIGE